MFCLAPKIWFRFCCFHLFLCILQMLLYDWLQLKFELKHIEGRRRLTEKLNERRILGVLNSCFFHINFIICHFSRLWGVDCCWRFFHCWYSFFSEAPGPFAFVSCIAVRKTDALNNYYQRLFLKSCCFYKLCSEIVAHRDNLSRFFYK